MATRKKKEKQICWNCLNDFEDKDVFWISKQDHSVLHCMKCIKENDIKEYRPYIVKRIKKI